MRGNLMMVGKAVRLPVMRPVSFKRAEAVFREERS